MERPILNEPVRLLDYYKSAVRILRRPGVYKIVNDLDGKVYVGSSVDMKSRMTEHRTALLKKKHHNKYLQQAWDSGPEDFYFVVIEEATRETVLEREEFWIRFLHATDQEKGYNLCVQPTRGRLGMPYRPLSQETREKISKGNKGRKPPPEICAYMGQVRKGVKRGPYKKEGRKPMKPRDPSHTAKVVAGWKKTWALKQLAKERVALEREDE